MMNRRKAILSLLVAGVSGMASEAMASGLELVPEARRVGYGRLSVFLIPIFDATLYAPKGVWRPDKPFALELAYLRTIKAKDIVERSVHEMKHQGLRDQAKLSQWEGHMRRIFPDVQKGSRLMGVRDERGHMRLFDGGRMLGSVDDPEFTTAFFNIWLGAKTSQPELRQALLSL